VSPLPPGLGWQEGAGAQIAIDPAAVDHALCDAQHVGSTWFTM
jgi:hypothetical protein